MNDNGERAATAPKRFPSEQDSPADRVATPTPATENDMDIDDATDEALDWEAGSTIPIDAIVRSGTIVRERDADLEASDDDVAQDPVEDMPSRQ